jgi:hypothetical protein
VETRKAGWTSAIERLRERCLELAPRPGSDADGLLLTFAPGS